MPLLLRIWDAFWPLKDYLLGIVFAQGFFYCLKLPCMKIYKHEFLQIKHPCFTWDLGPLCPSSHRLRSPGPGLQGPWRGFHFQVVLSRCLWGDGEGAGAMAVLGEESQDTGYLSEHHKLPVLEVVLTHNSYEAGTLWSTLKCEVTYSTLVSLGEKLKKRPAVLNNRLSCQGRRAFG